MDTVRLPCKRPPPKIFTPSRSMAAHSAPFPVDKLDCYRTIRHEASVPVMSPGITELVVATFIVLRVVNKGQGEALIAMQAPHRPGTVPALGLRAGTGFRFHREADRRTGDIQ